MPNVSTSPHADLFGLARLPGQAPAPPVIFFDDFQYLGGTAAALSTTTAATRYEIGGSGTEAPVVSTSAVWGQLNLITGSAAATDTCAVTTANPVARWITGATEGLGRPISFYARVKVVHATDHKLPQILIGLGNDDNAVPDPDQATLPAGTTGVAGAVNNFLGFSITTATGLISTVTRARTGGDAFTNTTTATTLTTTSFQDTAAQTRWFTLGWEYDGKTKIQFFVNRTLVATHFTSQSVPPTSSPLFPVFAVKTDAAVISRLFIDWIYVSQGGPRPDDE